MIQNETRKHADSTKLNEQMRDAQKRAYPVISKKKASQAEWVRRFSLMALAILIGGLWLILVRG